MRLLVQIIWLVLYLYYIEKISELEKGRGKRIVSGGIALGMVLLTQIPAVFGASEQAVFWSRTGGWIAVVLVLFLYVLFYDEKPLGEQWWKVLVPGCLAAVCGAEEAGACVFWNGVVLTAFLFLLALERESLRLWNSLLVGAVYGLLSLQVLQDGAGAENLAYVAVLEGLIFLALEGSLFYYHRGYVRRTEQLQQEVLGHQYQETKEIYLNMRGWRHDYHNHLQVMKAQMAAGRMEEMAEYLDHLEENLDSVDTYVKSGSQMVDAILNSKLTLAKRAGVQVNCKAALPGELAMSDVDLCVLLGNLLDNALESCEKIPLQQRFLRIYMAVKGSQFYVSIQNSAKEEPDFEEKNYITKKRGNHGLGMKRMKAVVDKYDGYLTLASEPGIFAAEGTLSL